MDPENRKNLAVLAAVAALIAVAMFVLHLFSQNMALERCRTEGRRDCAPVPGDAN